MAKSNKKVTESGQSIPDFSIIHPDMKPVSRDGIKRGYQRLLWEALSYVHYEISDKKLAAEFIKYCNKHFDKKLTKILKQLPDRDFSVVGKYTYLINLGATLDEHIVKTIQAQYESLVANAQELAQEKKTKEKKADASIMSIQDRMREQIQPLCSEWNCRLDQICLKEANVEDFDPYKDIQVSDFVKPAHAKMIREAFEPVLVEAQEVVAWKNPDIREGYAYMPPATRKDFLTGAEKIIAACDTVINSGKAKRTVRKKKSPNKQKLVSKVKYMESYSDLGLASINPVSILDASILWVYNTKNRKLGIYVADEYEQTLSISGTTIKGFDGTKSMQKTVRKPTELKGCDKLSRTKFDKFFKGLTTTETTANGRLNEHTLLLKVF